MSVVAIRNAILAALQRMEAGPGEYLDTAVLVRALGEANTREWDDIDLAIIMGIRLPDRTLQRFLDQPAPHPSITSSWDDAISALCAIRHLHTGEVNSLIAALSEEAWARGEGRPPRRLQQPKARCQVCDAWLIPGRRPDVHARAKRWLRRYWPALYAAITEHVTAHRRRR